jgi:hypothetical protein
MHANRIRILAEDNNRRGDLFGRLMADLFVALGYDQPRLNIHKSGRELDLVATHRLEPRRAIAECKAKVDLIGGGSVNKFVGVLDVEHRRGDPITGYFISLSGFTETAREQESKRRRTKVILLTGPQVADELVNGRILISRERATELSARCCPTGEHLVLDPEPEVLGHERGWIWAVYYTQGKARTHFALIHADGTPLARAVADQVITSDTDCGGELHTLTCLNPAPLPGSDGDPRVGDALAAYGRYLSEECGFIQLDGLPADSEVGSRRLLLENIFVPLHMDVTRRNERKERESAGVLLATHPRLALLAAPGGGKSTFLKRLAVAYVDPTRRKQIADNLPQRDWFPLFFRCRELRGLARSSFAELLDALAQREGVRQHAAIFRSYVDRALLTGRVLLLVDGLDEISDPGDRAAFVCTLRTALQAYPGTAFVVTSREAGFRHVAAHLAAVCTHATLSPFDEDDIRRLSVVWHRVVVGSSAKVRADAEQLASTISRNDRIRRLAINPLLLTTLMLVKRWVGSLPTRRAALYDKAVEVLLMTWNTEGHDPIPQEEALPQLCYLASAMMLQGVQKISRPRMAIVLQEARNALLTELGYVRGTVDHFIHRVEDRSSLLMMAGHDVEDGRLVEFFEFRHLTFQEFLTARALVEGWHPGRKEGDTLVTVLEPHLNEAEWREVIPLAAVLGGKATEALIQQLTKKLASLEVRNSVLAHDHPLFLALGRCLADEAAARPDTIRAAVRELLRSGRTLEKAEFFSALVLGRYGADFLDEARTAYLAAAPNFEDAGNSLLSVVWAQTINTADALGDGHLAELFLELLSGPESVSRCDGALGIMRMCFQLCEQVSPDTGVAQVLSQAGPQLGALLFEEQPALQFAASWALVWLGALRVWPPTANPDVIGRLFTLWRKSDYWDVRAMAVWALVSQPIVPRDEIPRCAAVSDTEFDAALECYHELEDRERLAVLVIAWYRRAPWSDEKIAERVSDLSCENLDHKTTNRTVPGLLEQLTVPEASDDVGPRANRRLSRAKAVKKAKTERRT